MNVRNIVTSTLTNRGLAQYTHEAEPVIAALEEAKENLVSEIEAVCAENNVEAQPILLRLGLVEAPLQNAESDSAGSSDIAAISAAISRMEATLNGLTTFARRNGYNG